MSPLELIFMFDIFAKYLTADFRNTDFYKVVDFNFTMYHATCMRSMHIEPLMDRMVHEYANLFCRAVADELRSIKALFRISLRNNTLRVTPDRKARQSIKQQHLIRSLVSYIRECSEVTELTPHEMSRLHATWIEQFGCGSEPDFYMENSWVSRRYIIIYLS